MKTVLITGASKGIGKSAALLFQKNGWNVAATMRDPNKESDLTKLENVKCYQLDVTDHESIKRCLSSVIKDFGGIDVLVNNAGVYTTNPLEITAENDIHYIIHINIIGTINMVKAIIPYFRANNNGLVINISSIAGKTTFPYQSLYHGTKWAIEGISEGLLYELRQLNIHIKIVEPGMVRTNLYDEIKNLNLDNYPAYYKTSFKNWHRYLMQSYQKGYDPDFTAKTIYKAAVDNKSRFRYASGSDTKMAFLLRSLLPFSMFKKVIFRMSGI
ncbi:NADP-dependent 3-hydroxy acid dehydrogenase YdfG [Natronincola peptidivorans]|uniref:NADP-dependent 3-hydroxy acid dehydrogenase YdfG n=1 Tax=Natronincola peptidivorans TaxID=426128 RepID=A0A1I0H9H4_9FIRM|nr:SDR family NAD(P)-dependent oxidoreductase [Natronincola peptidivorans]SET79490.1 NADP-dependent 3-hydroxy acid dehydrogenase YdfG [Natronincola peptidivorans]